MKKIFIRLGHDILKNGQCTGSVGILKEYDVIREFGLILAKELERDFDIKLFDSTPGTYRSSEAALKAGVDAANSWAADVFISCHANKYNGNAEGTEVFYYPGDSLGYKLAKNISSSMANLLKTKNRGAKSGKSLYEIQKTNMTAIVLEPLFVDNLSDTNKYLKVSAENLGKNIANILKENIKET